MTDLISVQEVYGQVLVEMGEKNERIVVVEADMMKASGSRPFANRFPERHYEVGVAEQNLIGVAAGLASCGFIPFASSFANFISKRCCDQVSISVAYNKFNVKICGSYAGLTTAKNGGTHISVEDIAIYRCMPNMVVIVPGDTVELAQAMHVMADYEGPVYLRMARGPMPRIFGEDYIFVLGKGYLLQDGDDATIISTGIMTYESIRAIPKLKEKGINVRHIHLPTIKPLDEDLILKAAKETKAIVTVENHSILGGLGGAVAELLSENFPVLLKRVGIRDKFGETATLEWLLENNRMSAPFIVGAVREVIDHKISYKKGCCNFEQ